MPKRDQGLMPRYQVERNDGKPMGDALVLEFRDPNSRPALKVSAETVRADGYHRLADDVEEKLAEHESAGSE